MTMPNMEAGLTPGVLFATSVQALTSYDLGDPTTFNGLTDRLGWRNQPNVVEFLKSRVKSFQEWGDATNSVFDGFRRGVPGGVNVPLPLAIIETLASQITGLPVGTWATVNDAVAAFEGLPGIAQVTALLTNLPGVALGDVELVLGTYGSNLNAFLGATDFTSPTFDITTAATAFVNLILAPLNLIPTMVGGLIPALNIPPLDASILTTGVLGTSLIPNITKAMSTDLQSVITNIFGGSSIGTVLTTGAIPGLNLSKITSGFGTGIASWLGAGGALPGATTLGASGLTGLATNIGTWLTGGGALPSATTLQGSQLLGSVASSLLSGTIGTGLIPNLDLSKITTGWATGMAAWLGAGGALPTATTLVGTQLLGALNPALTVAGQDLARLQNNLALLIPNLYGTPSGDPNWANVVALLHMDGTAGATAFTDSSALAANWTGSNGAVLSTTQSKFGGAALTAPSASSIATASAAASNFTYGTADFTIEMWAYATTNTGNYQCLYYGGNVLSPYMGILGVQPVYWLSGNQILGSAITLNAWHHFAICRASGYTRLFVDGVQQGNTFTDPSNYVAGTTTIGNSGTNQQWSGYVDEARITKGYARYTSNFTPPTAVFPGAGSGGIGLSLNTILDIAGKQLGNIVTNITSAGALLSSGLSGILGTGLIPGLDLSKITSGFGTGIAAWLGAGGALPGATTLGASGLTGLATNIGTWLTGGGALPVATTLQGSQLLGSVASSLLSGTIAGGIIPNLDLGKITTGFGTGIAAWLGAGGALPGATTLGASGLTGLATSIGSWLTGGGALPAATTLQGSQLLGSVASSLLSGTIAGGIIPNLDLGKITTGFGTGIAAWLGAGGALPGATTLASTGLTGLATGVGTWLSAGGALPSATTVATTALTGLATGIGTWLGAGGLLPAATAVAATNLNSTIVNAGAFLTSLIPGLSTSKITSGTFTNAMSPGLLPQTLWQATSQAGSNLIIGPDFEDSTITRTVGSYNAPSNAVGAYSTAQKRGGTQSFALTTAAGTGNNDAVYFGVSTYGTLFDQEVRCQAGQWFYSEIYVRAAASNTTTAGNLYLSMLVNDSTGVNAQLAPQVQSVAMSGLSSSAWTKLSGWYQVPAGYDRICPFVGANAQNVASQTFYLDDIRFAEETQAQNVTQQLFGSSTISAALNTALTISTKTLGNLVTNITGAGALLSSGLSGVLGSALIPGLDTSKIISGTFLSSIFPAFQYRSATGPNMVLDPNVLSGGGLMWAGTLSAGVIDVSTTQAHSGTQSLRITGPTTLYMNAADAGLQPIKCQPGQVFRIGAWVWADSANVGTGQLLFDLNTTGLTNAFVANTTGSNFATITKGAWTYCESVLTVAAGGYNFNPLIWTPGIPATDVYYVDDLIVREESTPQSIISKLWGAVGNVGTNILSTIIPGLDLSKITSGFGTGIAAWLGAGGALPGATTLAATGLSGLATNIGTWLTGGGALPSATTLQGSQLLGSVAATLLSGTIADPRIPGLDLSKITSGFGTGIAAWLGAGGALPGATTLAATGLTGLATSIGSWLTGGGALPSATTLQGSQLLGSVAATLLSGTINPGRIAGLDLSQITTGFGTGIASWLGAGGNLPSATTVAGQLVTDIQTNLASAVTAATGAGAASLGDAVAKAQQTLDQQIAAFTGTTFLPGKTITDFNTAVTNTFAQWVNSLKATSVTAATGPDVTAALQQQAAQATAQANLTAAIQAQQKKFYGGSGTAGTSANVNFTSTTVLPSGWTDISCALCAKVAKYNTPAIGASQTVSGIWSASDYLPKYLILRANSAFTTLVYAKIQSNNPTTGAGNCEIGCYVSGTKTVLDTFALPGGTSGVQQANQAYTFSATDYTFLLTGPGGLSRPFTDGTSTHVSQKDAVTPATTYIYGGFGNNGVIVGTETRTTAGNFTFPAGFTTGDKIDAAIFGAYGGGAGGGGGASFGGAGGWGGIGGWGNAVAYNWTYGTGGDIPLTTTTAAFTPGAGGTYGFPGGNQQNGTGGGTGGTSSLAVTGLTGSPKTATGGTGGGGGGAGFPFGGGNGGNGTNGTPGATQYATVDNGIWSTTPANGYGAPGSPGAAGGGTGGYGGVGADGSATLTYISTHTLPGTMNNWVFYDSGPAAGPATAAVATSETTTSASYADLATTTDQVTVVVGDNKMVWVDIASYLQHNVAGGISFVSVALSGANTLAASDANAVYCQFAVSNGFNNCRKGIGFLMPNLNTGATTFKLKYKQSGGTATFKDRSINVLPL